MPGSETEMRRQPLDSLAGRILLSVFAATFATALVVSWISIRATYASARGSVDRLYPRALDHSVRDVAPWLISAQQTVTELARGPLVADGSGALERRLNEAVAGSHHLDALLIVEPEGDVGGAVGTHAPALSRSQLATLAGDDRDGVRALRLPGAGTALVAWAPAPERRELAGLLGLLNVSALENLLEAELPDSASRLALVDDSGRTLVATGSDPPQPFPAANTVGSRDGAMLEYEVGGLHLIGSARALGLNGWRVAIQAPVDEALSPVFSIVTRILAIDLCVILAASALAYAVTARVVRPIDRLSEAARRIAQGQLDAEIPETGRRDEVGLLTTTFNDMTRRLRRNQLEIESANRELSDHNVRLQQANEVLNQLSITDGLTRLHNHRFFQDHLTREIKRVDRTHEPLSMLMLDIDDFKRLNDRFGHAAGDELLTRIALILNESVRESDLLARYGGEEFVILASGTDLDGARALAEKVRTAIAESSFILDDSHRPLRVTISVGVATFSGNRKRFFLEADQALYRAKDAGKNCVVVADDDCL
jgi:diguanylate cyclase (GGDEF)-like protein